MRADEDYIERVLGIVEVVPPGRVTTYGAIAAVVGSGPRLVGNVLARHGGPVPWWRVVRSDGSLPPSHHDEARACYLEEGTVLRRSGLAVDLGAAFWEPVDPQQLLDAYDRQLRGKAEVAISSHWDTAGPLWRAVHGDQGMVTYEDLSGCDLAELVSETTSYFSSIPGLRGVEWKTRGHDDLPGLHDVLLEAGFVSEEVETVMIGAASALAVGPAGDSLPEGVVVRRVDDDPDRERLLAAVSAMQDEVFGRHSSGGGGLLERVELSGGAMEVWVAQAEGGPFAGIVSAGRLEIVPGTDFAGLWGGATLTAWRGRGLYRALSAARAGSALARGVRWLQSDCTPMSRPILERSGLVAVTTTTPYTWTVPSTVRPTGR